MIWVVVALVLLWRLIRGQIVSRRLRRTARPIDEQKWNALLTQVADTLDVRRDRLPPISTLPAFGEPVTAGVVHPTVLMPEALFSRLTTQQLHDVLVHECAHAVARSVCGSVSEGGRDLCFGRTRWST